MKKKGFTLVEILIVIVLIGAIMMLVVPRIADIFKQSSNKTLKVQENEIKDAALLYLEDYCKNPVDLNRCPNTITRNDDYTFSGYILLNSLVNNDYIDEVVYRETTCDACIRFTNNAAKAYINCPGTYKTDGYDTCAK